MGVWEYGGMGAWELKSALGDVKFFYLKVYFPFSFSESE